MFRPTSLDWTTGSPGWATSPLAYSIRVNLLRVQSHDCHVALPVSCSSINRNNPDLTSVLVFCLQEKTKKILDIWVKGNTFPSTILSTLTDVVKEKGKGAYHSSGLFAKYLFCLYKSNQILPFLIGLRNLRMSN